ncbi:dimethylarginine dimethylaminohydrolase family protein [Granulibacter bethesdensis]|uniref:Amidinotransferase family protein n=1 Tax=Granulibacter bethesdensis TaxID=364410 RepID=A0AAN0VFZ9_9PROT|nr:arginine deiminase-related protein [Granulibacter bethesdensis]AHJ62991.1 Amidinotransferase family protein [Granulibacter bethesdensis]APH59516.1 Amidinotransferase family protein [Granulibacter bethesdensis]
MIQRLNGQAVETPQILMTDPAHYTVSYAINPWMDPDSWAADAETNAAAAKKSADRLVEHLRACGASLEIIPGAPGLPDMVFPANAGTVLDGRMLLARFLHPQRQGEEPYFLAAFESLKERGILQDIAFLPEGAVQEGAGDAIWDRRRGFFWTGFGQRSNREGVEAVARYFSQDVVTLELATPQFYHLDTCFCPLSGGDVLYYPPAFTPASLSAIEAHVAPEHRLVADQEDADRFCVNAVNIGQTVVMAQAAARLRGRLSERGYVVRETDLTPYIMSGGGAYCMTLRLDRSSR